MLRKFGVKGVKVQEVVSLDEEMMTFLKYDILPYPLWLIYLPIVGSKPIYGLIFLFRWREDDHGKQEASCPDGIWFANQTAENACASVALLNIVNNIDGIDLGEHLQHFKDFTMPFTPALRGDAINNFEFIKRIHNSFARKMDMLNSDLHLKREATSKKYRSGKTKTGRDANDSDASFHFIAFVPAMGKVWKFDGLERQPQTLGDCAEADWLELVKPNILARMTAYEEDQIEFSILGLVRDPLPDLVKQLAVNVKCLEILRQQIALQEEPNPAEDTPPILPETVLGPDLSLSLTQTDIDEAMVAGPALAEYQTYSAVRCRQLQQELSDAQRELRASIREEVQAQRADDDYATGRGFDYGPAVRTWLRCLARKNLVQVFLDPELV